MVHFQITAANFHLIISLEMRANSTQLINVISVESIKYLFRTLFIPKFRYNKKQFFMNTERHATCAHTLNINCNKKIRLKVFAFAVTYEDFMCFVSYFDYFPRRKFMSALFSIFVFCCRRLCCLSIEK